MIAYNHASYIVQSVGSVLEQDTPFAFELVVGEDCSTDGTRVLLRRLSDEHPGRMRLLLPERNQGMMANFMATLSACRGRYVALCEGDDYWVDPHKLRKQVAYLEDHPGASVCFHNAWIEDPEGGRSPFHPVSPGRSFGARDLLGRWLMPTASVVFRNDGPSTFPPFFDGATHGDLALFLLLAERGSLDYLDEIMSVYRLHPGGITTSFQGVAFNRRQIAFLKEMDRYFEGKHNELLRRRIGALHRSNAIHLLASSGPGGRTDRRAALRELTAGWRTTRRAGARGIRETLQVLLGLVSPAAYRKLRSWTKGGP